MTRSFKSLSLAAAVLAGLSTTAEAAPNFVGRMIITEIAGTCEWNPVGFRTKVRFTPANVGDNGVDSRMSFFDDWSAYSLKLLNGSFSSTYKFVVFFDGSDGPYQRTGVSVRFGGQVPTTILPTTNFVTINGQIKGWIGGPLCTATFRMTAAREQP